MPIVLRVEPKKKGAWSARTYQHGPCALVEKYLRSKVYAITMRVVHNTRSYSFMVSKSIDTKTSSTNFFCIFVALLDSKVIKYTANEGPVKMSGFH